MRLGKRKGLKSKERDLTLNGYKDLGNRKAWSRVSDRERACQACAWISSGPARTWQKSYSVFDKLSSPSMSISNQSFISKLLQGSVVFQLNIIFFFLV